MTEPAALVSIEEAAVALEAIKLDMAAWMLIRGKGADEIDEQLAKVTAAIVYLGELRTAQAWNEGQLSEVDAAHFNTNMAQGKASRLAYENDRLKLEIAACKERHTEEQGICAKCRARSNNLDLNIADGLRLERRVALEEFARARERAEQAEANREAEQRRYSRLYDDHVRMLDDWREMNTRWLQAVDRYAKAEAELAGYREYVTTNANRE